MKNKKIKIFKFWFGNQSIIEKLKIEIDYFNKNSKLFEIVLGPSKSEHEFLLNNFENYKKFYQLKKYAFMSDIYRFWIASKYENIIYMDATVQFNENQLYKLYQECFEKKLNCFVFESYKIVWSGFFISNDKNFFEKCLKDVNSNKFITSPLTLTKYLRKDKLIKSYKRYNISKCKCFDINFLNFNNNHFDVIKINPTASWRKANNVLIWEKKAKNFKNTYWRDTFFLIFPNKIQQSIFKYIL